MDLKQLRYFRAVAELGSFTAAAQHLHVAQPALSIAIRKLEGELGLTVLHRGERKVTPTSEGDVLLGHARRLLSDAEAAELEMRELQGLTKGEVRIGVPSMLGSYYFPPILMGFKHRYPELRLSVHEAGTRRLQQMIHDGELDVGVVVAQGAPPDLEARLFLREEMVACVTRDHPLAERDSIGIAEFLSHDLVVFKEGYFLREFIDRYSREYDIQPRIAFESNLIPLTKAIVRHGFGITTFLRMVVEQDPEYDLVAIPFETPVHLDLSLAWKRGGYMSRADGAFVDYVLEQVLDAGETDHKPSAVRSPALRR